MTKQSIYNEAVKSVVEDFVTQGKELTALDVTQKLRDQVNDGQLVITDRLMENVDGVYTVRIEYQEVKQVIQDLFSQGKLSNYTREFGQYTIYKPVINSHQLGAGVHTIQANAFLPANVTLQGSGVNQTTIVGSTLDYVSIIKNYLVKHGPATTKQIQSRLKKYPLTCQEIVNIARNNGLPVNANTSFVSHSVVSAY